MTLQDVFTLYEYNRWANGRTLEAAERLDAMALLKNLGNSFPSVRDTLAHILGAEWIWLRRWLGETPAKLLSPADFPTVARLRERFQAVDRERATFLSAISEERLPLSDALRWMRSSNRSAWSKRVCAVSTRASVSKPASR